MTDVNNEKLIDHIQIESMISLQTGAVDEDPDMINQLKVLFAQYVTGFRFFRLNQCRKDLHNVINDFRKINYRFGLYEHPDAVLTGDPEHPVVAFSMYLILIFIRLSTYRGIVKSLNGVHQMTIDQYSEWVTDLSDREKNHREMTSLMKNIDDLLKNKRDKQLRDEFVLPSELEKLVILASKIAIFRELMIWLIDQYKDDFREQLISERTAFLKKSYRGFISEQERDIFHCYATPVTYYNWGKYLEAEYIAIMNVYNNERETHSTKDAMIAIALYFAAMKMIDYRNEKSLMDDLIPPARLRESLAIKYMCEEDFQIDPETFFAYMGGINWMPYQACINDGLDSLSGG